MAYVPLMRGISVQALRELLYKQLNNNFGFSNNDEPFFEKSITLALNKVQYAFQKNNNKYYSSEGNPTFNPFNSGQYTIFLYYLSNILYEDLKREDLAAKVYYLNKMLNGVDLFYAIKLPDVFGLEHPLGTVMGRAKYNNCLFFYQNVTVGGNKGKYPVIGENVVLFANATVLGDSKIGDNCLISANVLIKDENVPPNTIVYGQSPCLIFKKKQELIDVTLKHLFKTEK